MILGNLKSTLIVIVLFLWVFRWLWLNDGWKGKSLLTFYTVLGCVCGKGKRGIIVLKIVDVQRVVM